MIPLRARGRDDPSDESRTLGVMFSQTFEAPQGVPLAKSRADLAYAQTDQRNHSEDKDNHRHHFGPACDTAIGPTALATLWSSSATGQFGT